MRFNDLPPAGPSFGDSAVGNFDFAGRGDRDGRAHVIQTVTDIDPEYDPGTFDPEQPPAGGDPVRGTVVRATYVFEDGSQITTEGFQGQQGIDVGTRRTFAITGGTGDVRGAEGTPDRALGRVRRDLRAHGGPLRLHEPLMRRSPTVAAPLA